MPMTGQGSRSNGQPQAAQLEPEQSMPTQPQNVRRNPEGLNEP